MTSSSASKLNDATLPCDGGEQEHSTVEQAHSSHDSIVVTADTSSGRLALKKKQSSNQNRIETYVVCLVALICTDGSSSNTAVKIGLMIFSGGGTILKVGYQSGAKCQKIFFWSCPSTFLALKVQLVV